MFSDDEIKQINEYLININIPNFKYPTIIEYFHCSHFHLFDKSNQDIKQIQKEISNVQNKIPLVLFYFIQSQDLDLYLAFYSNQVGVIYDLILGSDYLTVIFNEYFNNFILVPITNEDQTKLSYFIDFSNNFFLNAQNISNVYSMNLLEPITNEILRLIKHSNDKYFKYIIKLIVYYVPLIGIVTDDFSLSPKNYRSDSFPIFKFQDFNIFDGSHLSSNSNRLRLALYNPTFEFYYVKTSDEDSFQNDKKFYEKVYNKIDDSFIFPCYGRLSTPRTLLFKFICNKNIGHNKNYTNNEISVIIYSMLASITTLHECGFYTRAFTENYFFMDNLNRIYFFDLLGFWELDNRNNHGYGSPLYISPRQAALDIASPAFDIYVIAKFSENIFLKRKNKKLAKIFKEFMDESSNENLESLELFIKMHEDNLFLPKTNRFFIDQIFKNFFNFFFKIEIKGGKYKTLWIEAIENNQYKNLILKNIPSAFIACYSFTELEMNLKNYLNDDFFKTKFELNEIFKINFFSEVMNNLEMKNRTDEIIKQTPNGFQIMNKIFLYKYLIENGNENECILLAPFLETEIFNFIENLNECIVHAHLFQNSPLFIHEIIKNFYFDGDDSIQKSHSIIKYLIKSKATIDECSQILEHFEYLLYEDIRELDSFLCTEMSFLDEFNSKIINKPILLTIKENESVIEESFKQINQIVDEIKIISQDIDQIRGEDYANTIDLQKNFIEIIDSLENQQNEIDFLKK